MISIYKKRGILQICTLFIMMAFYFIACSNKSASPTKKVNIPDAAVWIGGADGGHWIYCEKQREKFKCEIFDDYFGDLICEGTFSLGKKRSLKKDGGIFEKVMKPMGKSILSSIVGYDGLMIELKNSQFLVPDGVLVFYFEKNHGLKKSYVMGLENKANVEF